VGENDFEREIRDRLIRIETKQDTTIEIVSEHTKTIGQHDRDIVRLDASTKSAHHRIDGIFVSAGAMGTAAGAIVQFITSIWPKGGGH
jgi:hypothetical protein